MPFDFGAWTDGIGEARDGSHEAEHVAANLTETDPELKAPRQPRFRRLVLTSAAETGSAAAAPSPFSMPLNSYQILTVMAQPRGLFAALRRGRRNPDRRISAESGRLQIVISLDDFTQLFL
jgi:hypothetical protein